MSKLIFLLFVAFTIKESHAARGYEYINSPENMFAIPISKDSSLICKCKLNVEEEVFSSDLVQKIDAIKQRFERVYDEVRWRTSHFSLGQQNNLYHYKNYVRNDLTDRFFKLSSPWRKLYTEIPAECRDIAEENEILHMRSTVYRPCWNPVEELMEMPERTNEPAIYRNVVNKLLRLSSEAFACEGDKCNEVLRSLEDFRIDEKLHLATSLMYLPVDDLFFAEENFNNCFPIEQTRTEYEKKVIIDTVNVLNCFELSKARNSSNSTTAPVNPSFVTFENFYHPPNPDLALKLNATKTRLQSGWRNLWKESKRVNDEVYQKVNTAASDLVSNLIKIFKQQNDSVSEYYEKRTNAESCFAPVDDLLKQIFHYDTKGSKCQLLATNDVHKVSTAHYTYEDLVRKVSEVDEEAFDCRNEECVAGVQQKLDNLEPQLQTIDQTLPLLIEEWNSKVENFYTCLQFNATLQNYREKAEKVFVDLKNCVNQNGGGKVQNQDSLF